MPEWDLRMSRDKTRPHAMHKRNPAGSKLARALKRAKESAAYGAGLRRMFTRNSLARMTNRKRKSR
jgi:hypothetical protein